MKNKTERFALLLWLSLLVMLTVVGNSCNYITGVNPTTGEAPGWVWSRDDSGHAVVIDRWTQQPIKDVTPQEAFDIITASETPGIPAIVDVRTPAEYSQGHLRDAININFYLKDFENEIGQLDKDVTYIVYCRSGLRSAAAQMVMEEAGFKYVINMTGGISNWEKDGLPVVQ